ncbi:MAG: AAA family ATPase [Clostridia bacterium]|nr:AAA family ATPase [Clostridia bacterium]
MDLIIIAGMPASGKSTYAKKLSRAIGYPIIEKDNIKEELFDTLGFNCYAEKRQHDVAATAVLLRVADDMLACGQSLIMVNNFRDDAKEALEKLINKYDCRCVIVFFGGDSDAFYRRYVERDNAHARHRGHALQEHYPPRPGDPTEYEMTREEFRQKFEMLGMDSLQVQGGVRIVVDATEPAQINVEELNAAIVNALNNKED